MRRPSAPVLPLIVDVADDVVADIAGVTTRSVQRWRRGGAIPDDFVADQLGTWLVGHPLLIWPDWGDDMRRHGSRATYVHGCRCSKCTEAERNYRANYRRRKREEDGRPPARPYRWRSIPR